MSVHLWSGMIRGRKLPNRLEVTVFRNGQRTVLPAEQVVAGDVGLMCRGYTKMQAAWRDGLRRPTGIQKN